MYTTMLALVRGEGEKRGRCDRENIHVEGEETQIYVHVQIFAVFYTLEF